MHLHLLLGLQPHPAHVGTSTHLRTCSSLAFNPSQYMITSSAVSAPLMVRMRFQLASMASTLGASDATCSTAQPCAHACV